MFANRLNVAATTLALLAAAPLASLGAAQAAPAAAAKPERTISIDGVEPKEDVFFVRGEVRPDYQERVAFVQRKLKSEQQWVDVVRFRTTDESTYRERVHALDRPGLVCHRVKIKGNENFATSYSGRVCIRTHRP